MGDFEIVAGVLSIKTPIDEFLLDRDIIRVQGTINSTIVPDTNFKNTVNVSYSSFPGDSDDERLYIDENSATAKIEALEVKQFITTSDTDNTDDGTDDDSGDDYLDVDNATIGEVVSVTVDIRCLRSNF